METDAPTRSRPGVEHDLADVLAALHQAMGLGGLVQREGAEDDGPDGAGLDEGPDPGAELRGDGGLECDRAGAEGGAGDREPTPQDRPEVDGRPGAAHEADAGQSAVLGQA